LRACHAVRSPLAFVNPAHERRAAEIVAQEAPDCRISISSEVLPVIREYPRLSTTVIDAYVGPRIANYLHSLEQRLDARGVTTAQKFLMQSNGLSGALDCHCAATMPH
jgi:N-methylhydantoinase A